MSEVRKYKKLTRKQANVFETILGELQLRYTPPRIYSSFRGDIEVASYGVMREYFRSMPSDGRP